MSDPIILIRKKDLENRLLFDDMGKLCGEIIPELNFTEMIEEFRYRTGIYDEDGEDRSKSRDMVAKSLVADALSDIEEACK